jgi:GxxExxY protein
MTENEIARILVDVCVSIHKKLGPGLLESAYEAILAFELGKRGISVERQVPLHLVWEGMLVAEAYRADLILDEKVLVELKSVERTAPVHRKQVLTYLRVSGLKLGMLVNFGCPLMKDGIERIIDGKLE